MSQIWKQSQGSVSISQPAYLCGLVAGLTVSEVIKYFSQEQSPAINQRIEYDITTNKIHRIDAFYG